MDLDWKRQLVAGLTGGRLGQLDRLPVPSPPSSSPPRLRRLR